MLGNASFSPNALGVHAVALELKGNRVWDPRGLAVCVGMDSWVAIALPEPVPRRDIFLAALGDIPDPRAATRVTSFANCGSQASSQVSAGRPAVARRPTSVGQKRMFSGTS